MGLEWKEDQLLNPFGFANDDSGEYEVFTANSVAVSNDDVYRDLARSLQMAISKLAVNVTDSSLFFLIHWEPASSILTISVTDDCRANDSRGVVRCCFLALEERIQAFESAQEEFSDTLRFWCKEYLSTDQGFTQFSLVALFTDTNRESAVIL